MSLLILCAIMWQRQPDNTSGDTVVKNLHISARGTRDMGSIPRSGRFPRVENDNPLQYSCLENSREPGGPQSMGWQRVGHKWAHTHTHTHTHILSLCVCHSQWINMGSLLLLLFFSKTGSRQNLVPDLLVLRQSYIFSLFLFFFLLITTFKN